MPDAANRAYRLEGVLVSVGAIAIGALAIQQTGSLVDAESAVFPTVIATVMIVAAVVHLVFVLAGRLYSPPGLGDGSWMRRALLPVTMLFLPVLAPLIGFGLSSVLIVLALTFVAMHERWTPFTLLVYGLAGAGVAIGVTLTFKLALKVPLPDGLWF